MNVLVRARTNAGDARHMSIVFTPCWYVAWARVDIYGCGGPWGWLPWLESLCCSWRTVWLLLHSCWGIVTPQCSPFAIAVLALSGRQQLVVVRFGWVCPWFRSRQYCWLNIVFAPSFGHCGLTWYPTSMMNIVLFWPWSLTYDHWPSPLLSCPDVVVHAVHIPRMLVIVPPSWYVPVVDLELIE